VEFKIHNFFPFSICIVLLSRVIYLFAWYKHSIRISSNLILYWYFITKLLHYIFLCVSSLWILISGTPSSKTDAKWNILSWKNISHSNIFQSIFCNNFRGYTCEARDIETSLYLYYYKSMNTMSVYKNNLIILSIIIYSKRI